ncbi:hypothetical protein PR001_g23726 [Phytophthora rubi]|uniref:DDE Tnp4 domain-containing protein n=1 Tax=Phytophthora rubi TaxID=129364 RepID=A0A6A3IK30_9STRA|nr:hypothetical protein PR001_g23726 [Phytophthora rubi]
MVASGVLLAMCAVTQRRRMQSARLRALRRRLHEEIIRCEWRLMVRMRHYVTLACLKDPTEASWMDTWQRGSDENLITTTSLSRGAFCDLLNRFASFYEIPSYYPRGGRPRKLQQHHQVLGLLLAFYVGSMQRASLCKEFGVPPSTLARVLNSAEIALSRALHGFSPARIVWPSPERQKALARLVARRHHLVQFTWGFLDGKTTGCNSLPTLMCRTHTITVGYTASSSPGRCASAPTD